MSPLIYEFTIQPDSSFEFLRLIPSNCQRDANKCIINKRVIEKLIDIINLMLLPCEILNLEESLFANKKQLLF
jgi:hypothetical protein